MTYLLPRLDSDTEPGKLAPNKYWYGIPASDVYSGKPSLISEAYQSALDKAEDENRVYRKSVGHETTEDRLFYTQQLMSRAVKDGLRVLNGIVTMKQLKAITGQKDNKNNEQRH